MNRNIEKFKRALNKFLDDNPNVDFDLVKNDFIEMYNNGEYIVKDDYENASELYYETFNLENDEEIKVTLNKVLEIYPFYYDAKIDLLDLNEESLDKYVALYNEIKSKIENEIDLNEINGNLWNVIEYRPLLRIIMSIGVSLLENNDISCIDYFEEAFYYDENIMIKQDIFLFQAYLKFNMPNKALEFLDELGADVPSAYHIIHALALMMIENYDKALDEFLVASLDNPFYLPIITGLLELKEEDILQIENELYIEPHSIFEAYLNITNLKHAFIAADDYVHNFVDYNQQELINYLYPNNIEFDILSKMMSIEPKMIKELVEFLIDPNSLSNGIGQSLIDLKKSDLKNIILNMSKKGFIKKDENKYEISYYGFCVLRKILESFTGDVVE